MPTNTIDRFDALQGLIPCIVDGDMVIQRVHKGRFDRQKCIELAINGLGGKAAPCFNWWPYVP